MDIKAIVFDSSVLIDLQKEAMQTSLRKIISYYVEPDKFMARYAKLFKHLQKGLIKEREFFRKLFSFYKLDSRVTKRIIEQHNSERDKLVKLRKINSVLTSLSTDYQLGLITNMPREWFTHDAKRLGLNTKLFKVIIFSSDVGLLKPNARLFKKACATIREKPASCIYVTNHELEAFGAKRVGMPVICIGLDAGDMRVDSIDELTDILDNENSGVNQLHEVNQP